MVKIGSRTLVATYPNLQIPEGDVASIDLDIYGWKFNLEIEFDNVSSEQGVQVRKVEGGARIVFRRWDNTLGVALTKPATLATLTQGGTLEFLAVNYRVGALNIFSLQLLHNVEMK